MLVVASVFAYVVVSDYVGGLAVVTDLYREHPDAYYVVALQWVTAPPLLGWWLAILCLIKNGGLFNEAFWPLSIAINTLIYSSLLLFIILRRRKSQS